VILSPTEIVIGPFATGEGSNMVVLGNSRITDTYLKGRVRVNDDLHVEGIARAGGIELGYLDRPRATTGLERGKVFVTASKVLGAPGGAPGSNYSVYNDSAAPVGIVDGTGLTLRWGVLTRRATADLPGADL
jgi:hypothetical protein